MASIINRAKLCHRVPPRLTQAQYGQITRRSIHVSTNKPTIPLIINGKDVETASTFQVISPLTGKEVWSMSCAGIEHVQEAIQNAHGAFTEWSQTKASHRRDLFLRAADVLERRKGELGSYMHQEIGANKDYQDFIVGLSVDGLRDTAGRIAGAVQGSAPESNHPGMKAVVYKKPYGVNLGIAPWWVNRFPVFLAAFSPQALQECSVPPRFSICHVCARNW